MILTEKSMRCSFEQPQHVEFGACAGWFGAGLCLFVLNSNGDSVDHFDLDIMPGDLVEIRMRSL